MRAYKRKKYWEDPLKRRESELRRNYGIDLLDFDALNWAHNGRCAICGREPSGQHVNARFLHVDHCHTSGEVRGLLCFRCNTYLGWFEQFRNTILPYLEN